MLKHAAVAALALATTQVFAIEPANDAKIRAAILEIVPKAKVDSVADAAVPGFYEVVLGGEIVYVSADAKYLFTGSVWDLGAKKDLTDMRKASLRKVARRGNPRVCAKRSSMANPCLRSAVTRRRWVGSTAQLGHTARSRSCRRPHPTDRS